MIIHVEPFDLAQLRQAALLLGLPVGSLQRDLFDKIKNTARPPDRARLLGDAQRLLADRPRACLPVPAAMGHRCGQEPRGLWKDMPVFVNDLSVLSLVGGMAPHRH